MSLVTLGSAAYDTLDSPFGSRVRALGGAGVYASHGYERSHKEGVENTLRLLVGYTAV